RSSVSRGRVRSLLCRVFFLNEPSPAGIYPLSLHDALPILRRSEPGQEPSTWPMLPSCWYSQYGTVPLTREYSATRTVSQPLAIIDRKSTRLNSSHVKISYAVFCLKKKKKKSKQTCDESKKR